MTDQSGVSGDQVSQCCLLVLSSGRAERAGEGGVGGSQGGAVVAQVVDLELLG